MDPDKSEVEESKDKNMKKDDKSESRSKEDVDYHRLESLAQIVADKQEQQFLVGLQYVLEVRNDEDTELSKCSFVCVLCSKKMQSATLIAHIKSVPHKIKFTENHCVDIYEKYGNISLKSWTATLIKEFFALLNEKMSKMKKQRFPVCNPKDMAATVGLLKHKLNDEKDKNMKEQVHEGFVVNVSDDDVGVIEHKNRKKEYKFFFKDIEYMRRSLTFGLEVSFSVRSSDSENVAVCIKPLEKGCSIVKVLPEIYEGVVIRELKCSDHSNFFYNGIVRLNTDDNNKEEYLFGRSSLFYKYINLTRKDLVSFQLDENKMAVNIKYSSKKLRAEVRLIKDSYGFLIQEEDLFFRITDVHKSIRYTLRSGDWVYFNKSVNPINKKPIAINITMTDISPSEETGDGGREDMPREGNRDYGDRDFSERGRNRDFGERGPSRDFGDRGSGRDFGDRGSGRDFGDRGSGRDFGDRGSDRDFGERGSGRHFDERNDSRDYGGRFSQRRSRSPRRRSRSPRRRSRSPRRRSRSPPRRRSKSPPPKDRSSPPKNDFRSQIPSHPDPYEKPTITEQPMTSRLLSRNSTPSRELDSERRPKNSRENSPKPRIDSNKRKSPPTSENPPLKRSHKLSVDPKIVENFNNAIRKIKARHEEQEKMYHDQPESHPSYAREWKIFWERRFNQLKTSGHCDPNTYDYRKEWVGEWYKRMNELNAESFKYKRQLLMDKLRITEEDLIEYEKMSRRRSRSPSPWENDDNRSSHKNPSPPRNATKGSGMLDVLESDDHYSSNFSSKIEYSVIGTIRCINELDTQLGLFKPAINVLLEHALSIVSKGKQAVSLFDDEDNLILLKLVKEKLTSQMSKKLLNEEAEKRTRVCLNYINWLQNESGVKPPVIEDTLRPHLGLNLDEIARDTRGMDSNQIATHIAMCLLKIGKADVTENDLHKILTAVVKRNTLYFEQVAAEKKAAAETAAKLSTLREFQQERMKNRNQIDMNKKNKDALDSSSITSGLLSLSRGNSSNAPEPNVNPSNEQKGMQFYSTYSGTDSNTNNGNTLPNQSKTALFPVVQPTSQNRSDTAGLSLLKNSYEDDQPEDLDYLSLEELLEMLVNYKNLTQDKQQALTNTLKKMESTDRQKVTKLRAAVRQTIKKRAEESARTAANNDSSSSQPPPPPEDRSRQPPPPEDRSRQPPPPEDRYQQLPPPSSGYSTVHPSYNYQSRFEHPPPHGRRDYPPQSGYSRPPPPRASYNHSNRF